MIPTCTMLYWGFSRDMHGSIQQLGCFHSKEKQGNTSQSGNRGRKVVHSMPGILVQPGEAFEYLGITKMNARNMHVKLMLD